MQLYLQTGGNFRGILVVRNFPREFSGDNFPGEKFPGGIDICTLYSVYNIHVSMDLSTSVCVCVGVCVCVCVCVRAYVATDLQTCVCLCMPSLCVGRQCFT